jgi:hypothetical protein
VDGYAWLLGLGVAGASALVVVWLMWRARARRRRSGARQHQARQLKLFAAEARADLMRRLTDYQDLDQWQASYDDWCRRVAERLSQQFPPEDKALFEAEMVPPLGTLGHSRTPRRDGLRLALQEKLGRLERIIERHLGKG